MNIDTLYNLLDSDSAVSDKERHLRTYFLGAIEEQQNKPEESQKIAYDIAGLLSTRYARELSDDHKYAQIMLLAGELELPQKLHSSATWEELRMKIRSL